MALHFGNHVILLVAIYILLDFQLTSGFFSPSSGTTCFPPRVWFGKRGVGSDAGNKERTFELMENISEVRTFGSPCPKVPTS